MALDLDRLLRTPIQECKRVPIKFKRTKPSLATSSFLLKLPLNRGEEKVGISDLRTYMDQLVDSRSIDGIIDLSTENEQILQIQYETDIG